MDTSEYFGCCRAVVEVDKALVAKEKEGRKEEVKEVSMLMMEYREEGGEGKGAEISWESAVTKVHWWPPARCKGLRLQKAYCTLVQRSH